jgi:hypothetical protein
VTQTQRQHGAARPRQCGFDSRSIDHALDVVEGSSNKHKNKNGPDTMTTPISAEQWQAYRNAGHADTEIMKHFHYDPTPAAPPLPGPALPGNNAAQNTSTAEVATPCSTPDLSGRAYGVAEGRMPPDGTHRVRVIASEQKRTQQVYPMGATFIRFVILESTSPDAEIGGEYSKAYSHNPADGFGRPLDDLKGWITQVVEHKHPEWRPRVAWDNRFVDYCNGPEQGAVGCEFRLRTEKRAGTRGRDFVKFDWGKGVIEPGAALSAPLAPPALTLPPMPAPSVPSLPAAPPPPVGLPLPPMPGAGPGAPPPLPAPGVGAKPPGWQGAWPPGSAS